MTAMTAPEARRVVGRRSPGKRQSQAARLCIGMLKGALLGAHLALVIALGIGLVVSGGAGAANAAVGGALVVVFFASGQAVQLLAGELADGTGMALLMGSYLARVAGLGLVFWLAMANQSRLAQVFDRTSFFAGASLTVAGWLAGIFVVNARQHVHVYDRDADTGDTA